MILLLATNRHYRVTLVGLGEAVALAVGISVFTLYPDWNSRGGVRLVGGRLGRIRMVGPPARVRQTSGMDSARS